ncbi:LamG-like jellyroll fold domain-containing protein [Streptomyces sp. NPDC088812]|uniref:LamG-like jellyroll fold domain-containing protein n=1 Tax=Streptomyces sp. NPDC088812 TaxID=3365905 RepID=UPI0038228289
MRYVPALHAWQLVVPHEDAAGAPERVVSQVVTLHGSQSAGHRLAVVYDDATDRIKLYVDGVTNAGATAVLPDGRPGSGALQVGRAMSGDGWGEYLHGDVDEIRAYRGALTDRGVLLLG